MNQQKTAAISVQIHRVRGARGRILRLAEGPKRVPAPAAATPAEAARMLALAHHLDRAIHDGRIASGSAAAERLGLTPSRLYQVLALVWLAPDIQESVLLLEAHGATEPLTTDALIEIARVTD